MAAVGRLDESPSASELGGRDSMMNFDEEEAVDAYEHPPPCYIDDILLRQSVDTQGPSGIAGRIAREEGIGFNAVTRLRLDKLRILEIVNLWPFSNLVELQLDNNLIEKIENLEELVNLERLDLSFNQIDLIEGLNSLTKLADLSLYHNNIRKIENLDLLTQLEFFSIGSNKIDKLDNLFYLRRFSRLRSLNLSDNTICQQPYFREYVAAFLPRLCYLDSRPFPEPGLREKSEEKYGIQAGMIEEDELALSTKLDVLRENQRIYQLHCDAFVEDLIGTVGEPVVEVMFGKDKEARLLRTVQVLGELEGKYRAEVNRFCGELFEQGLARYQERMKELREYEHCTQLAMTENRAKGIELVEELKEKRNELRAALVHCTTEVEIEELMHAYNQTLLVQQDQLFGIELLLVDQIEDVTTTFMRQVGDMIAAFLEYAHHKMAEVRNSVNNFHENYMTAALSATENLTALREQKGIDEKVIPLLMDRDILLSYLKTAHDYHLLVVDTRDDKMIKRANQWVTELADRTHENLEVSRNRERVSDILRVLDSCRTLGEDAAEESLGLIHIRLRKLAAERAEKIGPRKPSIKFGDTRPTGI